MNFGISLRFPTATILFGLRCFPLCHRQVAKTPNKNRVNKFLNWMSNNDLFPTTTDTYALNKAIKYGYTGPAMSLFFCIFTDTIS